MAAAGTVLMQVGWFLKFFDYGHYSEGSNTLVPMGVFLGFTALFSVAAWRNRKEEGLLHPAGAALGLGAVAMIFAFVFLAYQSIGARPWLLYAYVLLLNLAVMAGTWFDRRAGAAFLAIALATFAHLFLWTTGHLTADLLPAALTFYVLFGVLHIVFIAVLERRSPGEPLRQTAMQVLPAMVMALMLMPVFRLAEPSFLQLYGAILVFNVFVMVCAWRIPRASIMQWSCGLATFVHLAVWTERHMTANNLGIALAAYLIFGAMHVVFTVVQQRRRPEEFGGLTVLHAMHRRFANGPPAAASALSSRAVVRRGLWHGLSLQRDRHGLRLALAAGGCHPVDLRPGNLRPLTAWTVRHLSPGNLAVTL